MVSLENNNLFKYLTKISQGLVLSVLVLFFVVIFNKGAVLAQFFLYETMPNFKPTHGLELLLQSEANASSPDGLIFNSEEIPPEQEDLPHLIGINDVIYQPETDTENTDNHFSDDISHVLDYDRINETDYLKQKFYVVDKRTDITLADFDIEKFLEQDLTVETDDSLPKVVIFNTHSTEMYADSQNDMEGVMGVAQRLCDLLKDKYGINAVRFDKRFDLVDGKSKIMGAYERMEPSLRKFLADNPSIEVAIDVHRDGLPDDRRLVVDMNGKATAPLMFVNGLSKLMQDGQLQKLNNLPNQNLSTNLAFSFRLQLAANAAYPGLMRKIYLNAYRYSLHMLPKSILVEVGAQTNTKQEAFNAAEPLADMIASVVLKKA